MVGFFLLWFGFFLLQLLNGHIFQSILHFYCVIKVSFFSSPFSASLYLLSIVSVWILPSWPTQAQNHKTQGRFSSGKMHQIQAPSAGHRGDAVFGIVSGDYLCSNWLSYNTFFSHYSYLKKVGIEWADVAAVTTPVLSCSAERGCARVGAQASRQGIKIPVLICHNCHVYFVVCQVFWRIIMCIFAIHYSRA